MMLCENSPPLGRRVAQAFPVTALPGAPAARLLHTSATVEDPDQMRALVGVLHLGSRKPNLRLWDFSATVENGHGVKDLAEALLIQAVAYKLSVGQEVKTEFRRDAYSSETFAVVLDMRENLSAMGVLARGAK